MAEQPRWYVIHTYSSYEAMVKDSLEKLIENNNLQENIFEIKIPTEETLEEKASGKKKLVERKKFPCYVFLKMIYSNDIWYLVTNTRGGTGFVGPQGRPLPLTDEEVAIERVIRMVKEQKVTTITGKDIDIKADSICVHGDGVKALEFVEKIRQAMANEGIKICSIDEVVE